MLQCAVQVCRLVCILYSYYAHERRLMSQRTTKYYTKNLICDIKNQKSDIEKYKARLVICANTKVKITMTTSHLPLMNLRSCYFSALQLKWMRNGALWLPKRLPKWKYGSPCQRWTTTAIFGRRYEKNSRYEALIQFIWTMERLEIMVLIEQSKF